MGGASQKRSLLVAAGSTANSSATRLSNERGLQRHGRRGEARSLPSFAPGHGRGFVRTMVVICDVVEHLGGFCTFAYVLCPKPSADGLIQRILTLSSWVLKKRLCLSWGPSEMMLMSVRVHSWFLLIYAAIRLALRPLKPANLLSVWLQSFQSCCGNIRVLRSFWYVLDPGPWI